MRTPVLLLTLGLVGCLTDRQRAQGRDRDGDGFESWELGGADCDDSEPSVNPDGAEVCGNGLDDDCDGWIDDRGAGERTWYVDADGDGVPGSNAVVGCEMPAGAFPDLTSGVDCDDADPDRSPHLSEVWYDGIDQDCDGNDDDQDRDGFGSSSDCDDQNETVNPGSLEICNNGLDDDCDGGANHCGPDYERTPADVYARLGFAAEVIRLVDVSGDGLLDLVVADADVVRAYFAPLDRVIPAGQFDLQLSGAADRLDGFDFGDFNGDGVADWVVADPSRGRVAVWMSPSAIEGPVELSDLPSLIEFGGEEDGGFPFGRMVRVVPGVRGPDGDSLIVAHQGTAQLQSGGSLDEGIRYYRGPWTSSPHDAASPDAEVEGFHTAKLGWPHQLVVDRYVPVLGDDGTSTGMFPLKFPHADTGVELSMLAPWFDTYELFGLSPDVSTIGDLRFPATWDPFGAPIVDAFVLGLDGVFTGSFALPRSGDLLSSSRPAISTMAQMEWSTASGNPTDTSNFVAFGSVYCDAEAFGEIVMSGMTRDTPTSDPIAAVRSTSTTGLQNSGVEGALGIVRGQGAGLPACGDVTGDGYTDLVVADVLSGAVIVFEGTAL